MKVLAMLRGGTPAGVSPYKLEAGVTCGFCHAAYELYAERRDIETLPPIDLSRWSVAAQAIILDYLQGHHAAMQRHSAMISRDVEWPSVPSSLSSLGEQRRLLRFPMRQGVTVRSDGLEIHAISENVSTGGMFFYAENRLTQGARVELDYITPEQELFTPNLHLRCSGKVVRVEAGSSQQEVGIAVQFDRLEMCSSQN